MQEALSKKYRLEPEIAAYLAEAAQTPAPVSRDVDLVAFRAWYQKMAVASAAPLPPGVTISDDNVPGPAETVRIRCYCPSERRSSGCLIYFHGGGWVLGNLDTHDDICAELAVGSNTLVIAVEYRLAPEHAFPAALEDAWSAYSAVVNRHVEYEVDSSRVIVGGDSAGANLAAAQCLLARDRGGPKPWGQLLIYPALSDKLHLPSHYENADAPILTVEEMEFFWQAYMGEGQAEGGVSPYAAPLSAPDLSGLPAAMILTMEYDPLRDDGRFYAGRLRETGTEVTLKDYIGLVHGCLRARHRSPTAGEVFKAACDWVRQRAESDSAPSR
jgi:acetyl esterase